MNNNKNEFIPKEEEKSLFFSEFSVGALYWIESDFYLYSSFSDDSDGSKLPITTATMIETTWSPGDNHGVFMFLKATYYDTKCYYWFLTKDGTKTGFPVERSQRDWFVRQFKRVSLDIDNE